MKKYCDTVSASGGLAWSI